jgi:hypothetical protein
MIVIPKSVRLYQLLVNVPQLGYCFICNRSLLIISDPDSGQYVTTCCDHVYTNLDLPDCNLIDHHQNLKNSYDGSLENATWNAFPSSYI